LFQKILVSFQILVLGFASAAWAAGRPIANPDTVVTLRTALALALEQNPELAAFSWDVRSAEAKILQARLRPNLELGIQTEDFWGTKQSKGLSRSQTTLQLSQIIELGRKRRARVREATLGRELATLDYETKRLDVLKKTAQAFVDALAAQRRVELAEENVNLAAGLLPDIQKRIEAGKASTVERTRSDVVVASARIEADQARRALIVARQHLAAQWGSTEAHFLRVVGDLDRVEALPLLGRLILSLTNNPEIERWAPETERREAAVRLQLAEAVPNLTLFGGPRYHAEGDEYTNVIGFSLPLPFWNRNQGAILDARYQLAKAADERLSAVTRLSTELSDAYQTVQRTANEIRILKESVLPGAESAAQALQEGYLAGRYSYLEVNEARRTLTAARLQYLQALTDYHKAVAEIEALTARPFQSSSEFSK